MQMLLTVLSLAASVYTVSIFFRFAIAVWREKSLRPVYYYLRGAGVSGEQGYILRRLTPVLLFVSALALCLEFYITVVEKIPEDNYTVKAELNVKGDSSTYSHPVLVAYVNDTEYLGGEEEPNYLVKGSSIDTVEVRQTFLVLNEGTPRIKMDSLDSFEFYGWDKFPDEISPGSSYDVELYGSHVTKRDRRGDVDEQEIISLRGTLEIPIVTKGSLGVTMSESFAAVSLGSKAWSFALIVAAVISFFMCVLSGSDSRGIE